MSFFTKIFGDPNAKVVALLRAKVDAINALEPSLKELTSEALAQKTQDFKDRIAGGATLNDILTEAFAVVREASRRTLGQRHFDVQLIGGMVLNNGQIAEMFTGEGKTLTSTLSVYLNALEGKGVHVVTPNDYLARRDAVWMGQVYHALGLSVGIINAQNVSYRYDPHYKVEENLNPDHGDIADEGSARDEKRDATAVFRVDMSYLRPSSRQESYRTDITYGTNNEYGFDYLRDNMVVSETDRVQRGLHYAIVDEIDSILIDEARTPLIISAPAEEPTKMYFTYAEIIRGLIPETDYSIDEKMRSSILSAEGIEKVERALGVTNLYTEASIKTVHHIENALKAHALFRKDKDYVVSNDEIIIVDEFTGRLMHGRRYSEGLHQAIEAKEGVTIQRESETLATITFQNYFRMYKKLSGMTGTASTEAEEFSKIYNLEVVTVPSNRIMVRKDLADRVYRSEKGKFKAVIDEIKMRREAGQPLLVGTASIEKNELLSSMMVEAGIPHEVLNAKNHEREAAIIAQAGRPGAVTIATNMAGRGVDIILGGNPPDVEIGGNVRNAGGLCVIGTERHESRRIDNQLRGRSGRQGDPGVSQFYLSLEDDLMRIFGSERMKGMMERLNFPEDMPIENGLVSKSIEQSQKRVESHNFDIRKHLLEYDDVLNRHRTAIYGKRNRILALADSDEKKDRDELSEMVVEMIERDIERILAVHTVPNATGEWTPDGLEQALLAIMPMPESIREEFLKLAPEKLGREERAKAFTDVIEKLLVIARHNFEGIRLRMGNEIEFAKVVKNVMLRAIDLFWVEHLVAIDHLRTSIGLQGYGQRDPLIEYKKQAFLMFNSLNVAIDSEIVATVFRVSSQAIETKSLLERAGVMLEGATKVLGGGANAHVPTVDSPDGSQKVGRNDSCPCGSGKKYKKCHGA